MQVSVTTTEGLKRRMTVAVPPEQVEKQVQARLKSLAGSVKLDGFRPGKVPMRVVENRYGARVRQEVSQDIMQESFRDAISQENLRPVGQPQIESVDAAPGKSLEYTATFEVYPEINLSLPDNIKLERPTVDVSDGDVDTVIERIRKQNIQWNDVERAAQDGDRVRVDFVGTLDGEPFEGGEAKDFDIVLGSKTLVGEFEDNLVGAATGDQRGFDVQFPEDYAAEKLAGKKAHFAVTVHTVSAPVLPEVNDELAQKLGVQGGVDAFREQVRENIQREVAQAAAAQLKTQVIEVLMDAVEIEAPQALLENEINARMEKARAQLRSSGVQEKDITLAKENYIESAERSVKLGLVIAEILRQHKIEVSAEELRHAVEERAVSYEHPEAVVQWYYGEKSRLADLEALLLEDKAIDWIVQQATIENKPTSVTELIST